MEPKKCFKGWTFSNLFLLMFKYFCYDVSFIASRECSRLICLPNFAHIFIVRAPFRGPCIVYCYNLYSSNRSTKWNRKNIKCDVVDCLVRILALNKFVMVAFWYQKAKRQILFLAGIVPIGPCRYIRKSITYRTCKELSIVRLLANLHKVPKYAYLCVIHLSL